jgi:hypothetical protein
VIQAAAAGEDVPSLLSHYRARLTAFQRHLGICLNYYRSGGASSWWKCEALAITRGLEWCRRELEHAGAFRYRLEGLEIRPHCHRG